jgi:hypothetical protein
MIGKKFDDFGSRFAGRFKFCKLRLTTRRIELTDITDELRTTKPTVLFVKCVPAFLLHFFRRRASFNFISAPPPASITGALKLLKSNNNK